MKALVPAMCGMVPGSYVLPSSIPLGSFASHAYQYVGFGPTWDAFTLSTVDSYSTLKGFAGAESSIPGPIKYTNWTLGKTDDGKRQLLISDWSEVDRIREQQETTEIYSPLLNGGFSAFTEHVRGLSSPKEVAASLKAKEMCPSEFGEYVKNGLVSADVMSDLVSALIEKNVEAGFIRSVSFFKREDKGASEELTDNRALAVLSGILVFPVLPVVLCFIPYLVNNHPGLLLAGLAISLIAGASGIEIVQQYTRKRRNETRLVELQQSILEHKRLTHNADFGPFRAIKASPNSLF